MSMLRRWAVLGPVLVLAGCAGAADPATDPATDAAADDIAAVAAEPDAAPEAEPPAVEPAAAEPPEPRIYRLGESEFEFPAGTLLQTWPVIEAGPLRFARLAVQMPLETLAEDLAGITDAVQVDILAPQFIPEPDAVLATAFADWKGREEAPAQTVYKFDITSNRGATGQRIAYLRLDQKKIGLDSLSPFQPQIGAPIYLFALDGAHVTTLIECAPLPLGYHGADHCSLRRRLDDDFGYRVLFPQDLLAYWETIDDAARDYVMRVHQ